VRAADIGTLVAAGVAEVTVVEKLRVGVLSTGDELRNPDEAADLGDIYDANRPMLLADVARWGFEAVDLGRAPDERDTLRDILNSSAVGCDAILTSGGASAGDEDHLSALLQESASFALWRVAIKPGRPLSLGLWNGTPIIGLPGNPVAAQVCALVFGYPALFKLAGADWPEPQCYELPAAFTKNKKDGRVEYLRARILDGTVEVFASEGSGRISGLSWATGLVRLPHEARKIREGDLVNYIPFESFGL
jgi:molybdopterin molybdotransferase